MNPLTNVRNVTKLSQRELTGAHGKTSWHDEYRDSAWIFIGGLPYDLTEGDVLAIFSQWGEIVNLNLIRDKATGKSKGFGFICYENQKSTILAVDNFNGIKLLMRTIRVDHVKDYKPPKDSDKLDDITRQLYEQGCAPQTADSLKPKSVDGYELLDSEGEEVEDRDDGLGSHSVLKGLANSNSRSNPDTLESHLPSSRRLIEKSSDRLVSSTHQSRERNEDRSSRKSSKSVRDPSLLHREKEPKKKSSSRKKTSKSSKKSKRKHSSDKKDKKRRKHKLKAKSSSSESSSTSESSSSDSDSDSDSDSSSSSSADSEKIVSKKRRRH